MKSVNRSPIRETVEHGRCRHKYPFSSIGFEHSHNPLLAVDDPDAFADALLADIPPRSGRAGTNRRRQLRRQRERPDVTAVRLGLRANARQFALLVGLNALVGAMVGLERSVLPLAGKPIRAGSTAAILAFVVAFGAAKALSNLVSGSSRSGSVASDCSSSAGRSPFRSRP